MSLPLQFSKMHGAGNDFIMIDARNTPFRLGPDLIKDLCDRRTGIGADGLIIVDETASTETAFRMIYFNSDGLEAEMCGNGARCSVAFAREIGLAGEEVLFDSFSGILEGKAFSQEDIQVSLPVWNDLELNVDLGNQEFPDHHTCNTGVPHLVIPVPEVRDIDVSRWGSHYRHHQFFAPAGTNVNFVSRDSESGHLLLRTFERGVEAETLACGTGASATAVVLCQLGLAESPLGLHTHGGDELIVRVDFENRKLLLRGPAVTSFQGEVSIHG